MVVEVVAVRVNGVLKSRLLTVAVWASTSCMLVSVSLHRVSCTYLDDVFVGDDFLGLIDIDLAFIKVSRSHSGHVETWRQRTF